MFSIRRMNRKILSTTALVAFFTITVQTQIAIPTVTIGSSGRPAQRTGNGSADDTFNIPTHAVTLNQDDAFLSADAVSDRYSLYSPNLATDKKIAGISRWGSSGNYFLV